MCGQCYPSSSDAECCYWANLKLMLYGAEFTHIPSTHPVHVYTSCGFVPHRDRLIYKSICPSFNSYMKRSTANGMMSVSMHWPSIICDIIFPLYGPRSSPVEPWPVAR